MWEVGGERAVHRLGAGGWEGIDPRQVVGQGVLRIGPASYSTTRNDDSLARLINLDEKQKKTVANCPLLSAEIAARGPD